MLELNFFSFILLTGLSGWFCRPLFRSLPETHLYTFLVGFAATSFILTLAVLTGFFHPLFFLPVAACIVVILLLVTRSRPGIPPVVYLLFCSVLSATVLIAGYFPPYEAALFSGDASVYIASAFHLLEHGDLVSLDPVAVEMFPEEKNIFIPEADASHAVRLSGVNFVDAGLTQAGFTFFPVFPAWLGLGLHFLGINGFLYVLIFFSILSTLLLFHITKNLAGPFPATCTVICFIVFLPQFFYSRFPMSEIASQTLFLAGLWIVTTCLKDRRAPSTGEQLLAGTLWGILFLCRIDMLYLILLGLILSWSLIRPLAENTHPWRLLICTLFVFALIAFHKQIATGSYLTVWGLQKRMIMRQIWTPAVTYLSDSARLSPVTSTIVWILAGSALTGSLYVILKRRFSNRMIFSGRLAGCLLVLVVLAGLIGLNPDWKLMLVSLGAGVTYFPGWMLAPLLAGFTFLIWKNRRIRDDPALWLPLILFAVPTFFYIVRPLIERVQPIFARRFIPVSYPLFFAFAFSGLFQLSCALFRSKLRLIAFTLFVALAWVTLFGQLKPLTPSLFAGVFRQTESLATRIPQGTLVLIPRSEEGSYITMPLQFIHHRDTLSLPIEREYDPLIDSFLKRQLKKGKEIVLLLQFSKNTANHLGKQFNLLPVFTRRIQFSKLNEVNAHNVPSSASAVEMWIFGYSVSEQKKVFRDVVRFDDEHLLFANFHDLENGHRWSTGNSSVSGFQYNTGGSPTLIVVKTAFPVRNRIGRDVTLTVNDNIQAEKIRWNKDEIVFRVTQVEEIEMVTLKSGIFEPWKLKGNQDRRLLGIAVNQIAFLPEQTPE